MTQAGVGTNRYAYSGNDPVNASDPSGHAYDSNKNSSYGSGLGSGGYTTNFNSGGNSTSSNPTKTSGYAYGYSNIFGSFVVKKEADGSQTPIWRGPSGTAGANDAKINATSLNNGGGLISNTSKDKTNNPNGIYQGSVGQIVINGRVLTVATSCGSCFAQKAVVSFNSPVKVLTYSAQVQAKEDFFHTWGNSFPVEQAVFNYGKIVKTDANFLPPGVYTERWINGSINHAGKTYNGVYQLGTVETLGGTVVTHKVFVPNIRLPD